MTAPLGSEAVEPWPAGRLDDLHHLVAASMPDEELTPDDLAGVLLADDIPRAVLGTPDGVGAVAVGAHGAQGSIDLLAVAPEGRRQGLGTALVEGALAWLGARGCTEAIAGGVPPRYLWGGVDTRWVAALALLERVGFHRGDAVLNLRCATDGPPPSLGGADVVRVDGTERDAVVTACGIHHPHWVTELQRGIERGRAFAAVDHATGAVLGFACHGVWRGGWFGPTATFPPGRARGTGTALLRAALADLRAEGHETCEISWVGPVAFYARVAAVGAGRTFVIHRRPVDTSRPPARGVDDGDERTRP